MVYRTVVVPSQFDPTIRPIVPLPTLSVTKQNLEDPINTTRMVEAVADVVASNFGVRQLIHTVSYQWTKALHSGLTKYFGNSTIFTYLSSHERAFALEGYLNKKGSILLAPSFERGIDLPQDDCRVVIVTKLPYPYLGDKQVSARLHSPGGQSWYTTETIRSLVQMSGRGVRSADDFCPTYVMDKQFIKLHRSHAYLFPSWYKEAILWDRSKIWW
jgi:Rad3-related DNA helicase